MDEKNFCPKCGIPLDGEPQCFRCDADQPDQFTTVFYNFKINAWSLPAGLTGAFILQKFWVFHHLAILFCVIPVHEMGHAFAAWMNGRFALPIGAIVPTAGMTIIGYSYHFLVTLIYLAAFGYLGFKAYQQKLYFWVALSFCFIVTSIAMTFSLAADQVGPIISYGGVAGEFLLSAVLIISFYQPSFKILRWDFFRYPFFVMGCMAFVNACDMWLRIRNKLQTIPFGTAISADGAGDSNGDMNLLVQAGWSEPLIISKYLTLGKMAFTLILIQYIYSIVNSRNANK